MNSHKDTCGTVLFVDQEETASRYIRERFDGAYHLVIAHSATEALTYLCDRSLHIDVVVTDDKLPDRSSSAVLRQAIEMHPYIQCILLTADQLPDAVAAQMGQSRGWRVFEKPVELDKLSTSIEEAVSRSLRQQMRCQRFEAINDTMQFFGEQIAVHNASLHRLNELLNASSDDSRINIGQIREQAAAIAESMSRLSGKLMPSMHHALNEIGYAHTTETNITAGRMVRDTLGKMALTRSERDMINIVVKQDFLIPRTASLMDLALSNVLRHALSSAARSSGKPWVNVTVQVQGAPEIVVADSGDGVPDAVKKEVTDTLRTEPLTPLAQVLRTCLSIMRFMGGTVLLASYPLHTSQISLEFSPQDQDLPLTDDRLRQSGS
ncbi:DNA-binding transcriptional response regulator [Noviherbaspirillum pedocola]|uniref:Response regulatory domain-containing protein n=1 Tax=Noviherbaspirillum pedocola TaxID=2801341 RepID=A0A934SZT1_9BURK|nr:hypothetical protein [Noviherbaspirillum pedocola]MBK4738757.1 hypothetical protein [Noviherbaspirillum pedocola]